MVSLLLIALAQAPMGTDRTFPLSAPKYILRSRVVLVVPGKISGLKANFDDIIQPTGRRAVISEGIVFRALRSQEGKT